MINFAIIENNLVVSVIIADTVEIAETLTGKKAVPFNLENHEAGIGYSYDGEKFSPPIVEEKVPVPLPTE
jgi:hypothetical protein